ncbi:MAG: CPBP family intramembrane glutamic endopeptidase [Paludibacteraceae bacterium]|nr:CPBP family intramembrane glutamic endopeptidase [Paludibacteraceae bacterium]
MLKGKISNASILVRVLVWLGIMGVLTMVAFGVWFFLPNRDGLVGMKWLQLLQSVATFLLPALAGAYLWSNTPMQWLHLDSKPSWQEALAAVVVMLLAIPGINLLSAWNQQMVLPEWMSGIEQWMRMQEDAAAQLTEQFLRVDTVGGLLVNIGLMALLPAVGEELTFRGVVQGMFTRNKHVAIWATAAIFSFVHMQFYGFLPRMLLGAMFGYMLWWTGSLWVPMLMHFVNNCAAVVVAYLAYNHLEEGRAEMLDTIGTEDTILLGVFSICIVLIMMVMYGYFYSHGKILTNEKDEENEKDF